MDKDIDKYVQGAQKGDPESQYRVAMAYEKGTGSLRPNKREAFNWYSRAAEQGNIHAQARLGTIYLSAWFEGFSNVVESDERESVKWLLKAAERGHKSSQEQLLAYAWHDSVLEKQKCDWAKQFAEMGSELAYLKHSYCISDYSQKLRWVQKAIDSSDKGVHAGGLEALAGAYECGCGVVRDYSKSVSLLKKVGSNTTDFHIGELYEQGRPGLPRDLQQALYWYRSSDQKSGGKFVNARDKVVQVERQLSQNKE